MNEERYTDDVHRAVCGVAWNMARRSGQNYDDMLNAALYAVASNLDRFDPAKSDNFGAWACQKARWAIQDDMRTRDSVPRRARAAGEKGSRAVYLDAYDADQAEFIKGSVPFVDPFTERETITALSEAMERLTPLQARIVKLRFWHDMNLDEIGLNIGVTGSRIQQIFKNDILPQLRKRVKLCA